MYAWQPWSGHYVVPPTVVSTFRTVLFYVSHIVEMLLWQWSQCACPVSMIVEK